MSRGGSCFSGREAPQPSGSESKRAAAPPLPAPVRPTKPACRRGGEGRFRRRRGQTRAEQDTTLQNEAAASPGRERFGRLYATANLIRTRQLNGNGRLLRHRALRARNQTQGDLDFGRVILGARWGRGAAGSDRRASNAPH